MRAKERALLAVLALNVGHNVPVAALEAAVWGDDPPPTVMKSLRNQVVRLRRHLGAESIVTSAEGYRLALPPEAVDATRLRRALEAPADGGMDGGPAGARRRLAEAEALWRGEPLTDLADTPERQQQVEQLRESWHRVRDARIRADLDLGHHVSAAAELERLVAEEPLREPLWGLLMLALYRGGRQVDALRAYGRLRTRLGEEWGVDPSPELQRLQWQILRQHPQLELKTPPPPLVVPVPVTRFVGRSGQADQVVQALATDRLVTLHGPAGVGKSRLAVEVARRVRDRFPDGVWWVDLTVVGDRDGTLRRLAEVLGVTAAPDVALEDAVVRFVEHRRLLLVLDNCEHVVTPLGPVVLSLLEGAAGVRVLATSRVLLGVSGESCWRVPPLQTPPEGAGADQVLASEAVALFQQRRGRQLADVAPNTASEVGRLCRTLDGVPLAIELAAVQAHVATVHELNERLAENVVASARQTSPVAHHVGLSAAIDWSYADLEPASQRLFDWLSVFPGDFDTDAVDALAAGMAHDAPEAGRGHLARLVHASLIEAYPVEEVTRYRLLFVMREFATSRLADRGEMEAARRVFADHYRQLAVRAGPQLLGRDSGTWLQRLHREWVNLQAALTWSIEHDPPERTLEFVRSMGDVAWGSSSDLAADAAVLGRVLDNAELAHAPGTAWGWQALVTAAYASGDVALALRALDRAEQLFAESGDRAGLACVYWHGGAARLLALGDLPEAEAAFRHGIATARQVNAIKPEAYCLAHLVQLQAFSGTADEETSQSMLVAESLTDPDDHQLQAHLRMDRALLAFVAGDIPACLAAAQDCVDYSQQAGLATYEQAGYVVKGLGLLQLDQIDDALPHALRSAQIALDVGNSMQLGLSLQQLARIADESDDPVRTARTWGAATARAPVFPAFQPILTPSRSLRSLGPRFDQEQQCGAELNADQALALAIG